MPTITPLSTKDSCGNTNYSSNQGIDTIHKTTISNGVLNTQLKSCTGKRKANRIPLSPLNTDNSNDDATNASFKSNMYEDAEKIAISA
ncbi:unnamed protein product [Trifolium pratense]|uniref:Uncharacterized protein n=1 Tax=Trifolium pratense TaxID=57577 RepID=A0ACB0JBE7_TRIPR|nr:unnamed protein product [Trifolium pratense]